MELMHASHQWMTRPADERFTSLDDMLAMMTTVRQQSRAVVVPSRRVHALPLPDHKGLSIVGPNGHAYTPTHWAFGQLAALAEAPAGYLRTMPAEIAADCINYGLQCKREIEDVGVLLQRNGVDTMRAATGPNYGRIWNSDVVKALIKRFGNGTGTDGSAWKVPGEFGHDVAITKANTTLYASDRDMFVFLADEKNRIDVPNRRNGQPGTLSRGIFCWNSEVGDKTLGAAFFLFDYACCNRIVWGAQDFREIRIRHTASAPDKWLEEIIPVVDAYSRSSTMSVTKAIEAARETKISKLDEFLANRFGKRLVDPLKNLHQVEEGRPIETAWDVTTAATAYARSIPNQDRRVELERTAGQVLELASS